MIDLKGLGAKAILSVLPTKVRQLILFDIYTARQMNYLECIVQGLGGKVNTKYSDIVKQIEYKHTKNDDKRSSNEILDSIKSQFREEVSEH